MPRKTHGQPRRDAPGRGSLLRAIRRFGPSSRSFPTAFLSPPDQPGLDVRMLGTQTSSPSPMPTPTRSLSGPCPPARCDQDSSCADLLGGGQNHRPSHSHTKPSFSAQSEKCNSRRLSHV